MLYHPCKKHERHGIHPSEESPLGLIKELPQVRRGNGRLPNGKGESHSQEEGLFLRERAPRMGCRQKKAYRMNHCRSKQGNRKQQVQSIRKIYLCCNTMLKKMNKTQHKDSGGLKTSLCRDPTSTRGFLFFLKLSIMRDLCIARITRKNINKLEI